MDDEAIPPPLPVSPPPDLPELSISNELEIEEQSHSLPDTFLLDSASLISETSSEKDSHIPSGFNTGLDADYPVDSLQTKNDDEGIPSMPQEIGVTTATIEHQSQNAKQGESATVDTAFEASPVQVHTSKSKPVVIEVMVLNHNEDPDDFQPAHLSSILPAMTYYNSQSSTVSDNSSSPSLPPDLPSSNLPDIPSSPPPDSDLQCTFLETDDALPPELPTSAPPDLPPFATPPESHTPEGSLTPEGNLTPEGKLPETETLITVLSEPTQKTEEIEMQDKFHLCAPTEDIRTSPRSRNARSYSTVSTDNSDSIFLQSNLKRWDLTNLTDDVNSNFELQPPEPQASNKFDGLYSSRSATEFISRQRASSGVSWVSLATTDRSLGSISESAGNSLEQLNEEKIIQTSSPDAMSNSNLSLPTTTSMDALEQQPEPPVEPDSCTEPLTQPSQPHVTSINDSTSMKSSTESVTLESLPLSQTTETHKDLEVKDKHRSTGEQTRQLIKLYMHHVDHKLHYKMLGFNSETTTKEIVSAALEKSNLTEDPKQYAIHEISNSGGTLRVLEGDENLMNYFSKRNSKRHFELRKITFNVKVMIDIPGETHHEMDIALSTITTARQAIHTLLRQLGKPCDPNHITRYRLMVNNARLGDKQFLERDDIVLEMGRGKSYKLVILQERDVPNVIPDTREYQSKLLLVEELKAKLQKAEEANEQLRSYQTALETMDTSCKEQDEDAGRSLKELRELVAQMSADIAEKNEIIKGLTFTKKKVEQELETKSKILADLELAHEQYKSASENIELLKERRHSMDRTLAAHISTIQSMTEERQILHEKVKEMEKEITTLNSLLQAAYTKETNSNNTLKRSNIYSLLAHQPLQAVIAVEIKPTEQGLGIQLTNSYEEKGGCIVRTVSHTSAAKSLLRPGDRLLEVNGLDVSIMTHSEVSELLAKHTGSVQVAVTRLLAMENEGDTIWSSEETSSKVEVKKLKHSYSTLMLQLKEQSVQLEELHKQCERLQTGNKNHSEKGTQITVPEQKNYQQQQYNVQNTQPISEVESLKDHSAAMEKDELIEALESTEREYIQHKQYLDQLLAVVMKHNPGLLAVMSEVQDSIDGDSDDEGWC